MGKMIVVSPLRIKQTKRGALQTLKSWVQSVGTAKAGVRGGIWRKMLVCDADASIVGIEVVEYCVVDVYSW